MGDEELIGPICIITSNGIICMESEPAKLQREDKSIKLKHRPATKDLDDAVKTVASALPNSLGTVGQRRDIGRVAVYLAEAVQLINESGLPWSFEECWTIVKRPTPPERREFRKQALG